MRTLCLTLGLLLLFSVCFGNAPHRADIRRDRPTRSQCCLYVSNIPIPQRRVKAIWMTHKSCPLRAFFIVTTNGRYFCMSPDSRRAQFLYRELRRCAIGSPPPC